jgi:hypothetical protein
MVVSKAHTIRKYVSGAVDLKLQFLSICLSTAKEVRGSRVLRE